MHAPRAAPLEPLKKLLLKQKLLEVQKARGAGALSTQPLALSTSQTLILSTSSFTPGRRRHIQAVNLGDAGLRQSRISHIRATTESRPYMLRIIDNSQIS